MQLINFRAPGDDALQNVSEIFLRIDLIQPRCIEERSQYRPRAATTGSACEEMILFAKSKRANVSLDRVVIDLNSAIFEKPHQPSPSLPHEIDGGLCHAYIFRLRNMMTMAATGAGSGLKASDARSPRRQATLLGSKIELNRPEFVGGHFV